MQKTITLTNATLIKYTIFSLAFATIALLTIILPAEYNIDPTGIGHKLGLTVLSNTKPSVKAEITTSVALTDSEPSAKISADTIEVTVPAGRGVEYKFTMQQYQKLTYQWVANDAALYFDLHGEPEGDTTGYFESYAIATTKSMEGSFTTPFSGVHGWYWKNTSN